MVKREDSWVRWGLPAMPAPEGWRQEELDLKPSPGTLSLKRRRREKRKQVGHKLFTE